MFHLTNEELLLLDRIDKFGPAHTLLIDKNAQGEDQATLFFQGENDETITMTVTRRFAERCLEGCCDFASHRAVRLTCGAFDKLSSWRLAAQHERLNYARLWRKFGGEDPLLWDDPGKCVLLASGGCHEKIFH